ncbi:MAG: hypothetical protein ACR2NM_06790 [Bythopirellula sp.]
MKTSAPSPKQNQDAQAKSEFAKLMKNVAVAGFYGTASVTVHLQDGHIQYTRVSVDRRVQ